MADLQHRVREQLRVELVRRDPARTFDDPALFADVERLLRTAVEAGANQAVVLPELLGDPELWRLDTAMRYPSHRESRAAAAIVFVKRRLLMPVVRWLFEYSRDNFERQRYVNQMLFACVQQLAVENARLRADLSRATGTGPATTAAGDPPR